MKTWRRYLLVMTVLAAVVLLLGCNSDEALPTPIPTLAVRAPATMTPEPSPEPSATPAPDHAPRVLEVSPCSGAELVPGEAIEFVFDQAMDAASVQAAFSISPALEGAFEWTDASTLRFTPDSAVLERDSEYTITIGTGALAENGMALGREVVLRQRVIGYLEVSDVFPSADATEVAPDARIIVTFNRPVVALTSLDQQGDLPAPLTLSPEVQGEGEWINTSIYSFTPSEPLGSGQVYTATIAAGLTFAGAELDEDYAWAFTIQPPSVTMTSPQQDDALADPGTDIVLEFGQSMDRTSVSDRFTVVDENRGTEVSGRLNWQASTLRFVPETPLRRGASYEVRLAKGSAVASGTASMDQDTTWVFQVAPLPEVVRVSPRDGATNVDLYGSLQIDFSAPMEPEVTVNAIEITPTVRTYTYWQNSETELWVSWNLQPSTDYTVTLTTEAQDRFGENVADAMSWSFRSRATEPSISLLTEGPIGIYDAYQDTRIGVQYVNVSRINLALYQLTPEELVELTREGGWPNWNAFHYQSSSRIAAWSESIDAPLNDEETLYTTLPGNSEESLEPGIYLLVAAAPEVDGSQMHAFVVTPLNVTLKTSEKQALVWVTDLSTGQPVSGVDVTLYDYDGAPGASGTTGAQGTLMLDMPAQERWESVAAFATYDKGLGVALSNWTDGVSPWDFDLSVAWQTLTYRGHLFTDRMIYRPGQDVNFKAILRVDDDGVYSLPDVGTPIQATLTDSQGQTVWTGSLTLGDMGSADGQIPLSESASLGYYALALAIGDEFIDTTFQVAEYRAPEFQVAVTPDSVEYLAGEDMTVDVDATFFFGGPVSGASVTWSVYGESYYFDRWSGKGDYAFGEQDYYGSEPTILDVGFISEGTGTTGADGHLQITVPTVLQGTSSRRFTVEVSVVDINNQEVTGRTSAVIHAGDTYIGLKADRYVGTAGEAMGISMVTVDTQGTPRGRVTVDYTISREEWYSVQQLTESGDYRWENQVRETPVYTQTTRTDASGLATVSWTPPEGGTYRVLAEASDTLGNTVRSSLYLWVSGSSFVNWGRENNYRIDLVADRDSYAPGDTASILVPSPYEGPVKALLTIERGSIIEYRVIELTSNSETIDIPIEPEYAPDVFVSVVIVSGGDGTTSEPGYRVGMVMLAVSTAERELNVEITPDRAGSYQPGDEVTYAIRTTDSDGQPVRAELTAQMVDLAVESLVGGAPASIVDAFYRERGLAVNTALSLVRRHIAEDVASKESKGGGGGGEEAGLRTDFPDTALWVPALTTDSNGAASISVTLPDNLTTWRLRVEAATADTLVGEGLADIVSNLQVMVRPALPRFLVVGDQPQLGTVIHNNTDEGLEISVTAEADGLELERNEQTVVLDAGERTDLYWPATVTATDAVTITFAATSGDLRDSVRTTLPVYRATSAEVVGTSGAVQTSETEIIRVPEAADPEQGGLTVTLQPSLAAAMQEGLRYLQEYPYDCIEQTVSRFLPNLMSYRALDELGIERQDLEVPLSQQISIGLQRLYALQLSDGGWGWWSGAESMPVLSAYVLYGLTQARDAGYVVDDLILEHAVEYLTRYLDQQSLDTRDDYDTRATVLYALAEAGQGDLGRCVTLFEDRDQLSLFGKGYLAMALHLLEPNEASRVGALEDDFVQAAIMSSTGVHWEEAERSFWQMNTDIRSTAIILRALVWIDPESTLVPQVARSLTMARSSGRWESTQENVWSILALTDYMVSTGELTAEYVYSLLVDGTSVASGEASPATADQETTVEVPMSELTLGKDTWVNVRKDTGEGTLYYSAFLRYVLPVETIQPLERGVIVYREYTSADDSSRAISGASVNDLITVHLTLIAPHDLYFVVLEDPFPAGCEAVDSSLATSRQTDQSVGLEPQTATSDASYYGSWYRYWPTHSDLRDEKLALFATHLPRGTYEYTYQLRCTTAGEFRVIPAQAYEMYEPDVFGRTGGSIFTVAQ